LALEQLEDRSLPATFGIPWPNPGHLTVSFAPDGTQVGNQQSQLFQLLNSVAPTQTWEGVILRAFQTWIAPTNINLSVVPDSGDPLGTTGPLQGDPRFGDIRITAVPLPDDIVAQATPFDPTAGTRAGDVEFNSNYLYGMGDTGRYDLLTIALHEAGHSLGIADSSDPASPMNSSYIGPVTGITSADVAAIQSLYGGARARDAFEGTSGNGTLPTGTSLNLSQGGSGIQTTVVDANLDTAADTDVYVVHPGSNQTNLTVLIRTSGISLLMSRVTVLSPSGAAITSVAAADPLDGDLSVSLSGLQVGAPYYLEVSAASPDVFGAGSYQLQIVPAGASPAGAAAPDSAVVLPDDPHTNDTLGTATDLRQNTFRTDIPYTYAVQAAVSDGTDVDYYHVVSPQGPNGSPQGPGTTTTVMRVLVWSTTPGGLDPVVSIFDARGNPVADAQVLVNENGSYVIQVPDALANTDYYVAVRGDATRPAHVTGQYFLGINFGGQTVSLQSFLTGTLTQGSQDIRTLQVNEGQLFHFVLSADNGQPPAASAVTMTIFDLNGNVLANLTAFNGDTQSLTIYLPPGTYAVRFAGSTADGSPLTSLNYTLSGLGQSDPIVAAVNPTLAPAGAPADNLLSYYWILSGFFSFL
jgi:hypothetical protein